MNRISFLNKSYPVRELFLDSISLEVTISTSDLNNALMNKDGSYVSESARILDEEIYFFVERNEIELDDIELIKILEEAI